MVVWSEEVKPPAAVRDAWARNPVISLVHAARLPLRSFRTDVQSPEEANGFVARIPVRLGKDVAWLS